MANQQRNEESKLQIDVNSVSAGGRIGMYHLGQGLIAIQRMLNNVIEHDTEISDDVRSLSPDLKREAFTLDIREATSGSVHLVAMLSDPVVQSLIEIGTAVLEQTLANVLAGVLLKTIRVNAGENPFEVDDPMRPGLQYLATNADAGQIIFGLRVGGISVEVGRHTSRRLKELGKQEQRGPEVTEFGIVVGSHLEQHYIDVEIDRYQRVIRCGYSLARAPDFEPFTKLRTRVEFLGTPVWKGTPAFLGPPHHFDLRLIRQLD